MKARINVRRALILVGPLLAYRYCGAAKRDEHNGFPFTAAMEWRKAAEMSSWITLLANRYWREWERIMHLPRRLAEPIGLEPVAIATLQQNSSSPSELASRHLVQPRVTLQTVA